MKAMASLSYYLTIQSSIVSCIHTGTTVYDQIFALFLRNFAERLKNANSGSEER